MRLYDNAAMWLCDYVALPQCGYADMWVRSYVAFLIFVRIRRSVDAYECPGPKKWLFHHVRKIIFVSLIVHNLPLGSLAPSAYNYPSMTQARKNRMWGFGPCCLCSTIVQRQKRPWTPYIYPLRHFRSRLSFSLSENRKVFNPGPVKMSRIFSTIVVDSGGIKLLSFN